ncbi:MAG: antibiotic biosynthesis monooxygenase family protein [Phototrophicaceae bacterium]|jgi:heme-degrading monooxygenase HmoA
MFIATRTIQIQPGKKYDYVTQWQQAIAPRIARQPGNITAWIISGQHDDEVMLISQWQQEDHYRAWQASDTYRQVYGYIGRLVRKQGQDSYQRISAAM